MGEDPLSGVFCLGVSVILTVKLSGFRLKTFTLFCPSLIQCKGSSVLSSPIYTFVLGELIYFLKLFLYHRLHCCVICQVSTRASWESFDIGNQF